MHLVGRLQRYLRYLAQWQAEAIPVGPFTLFIRTDPAGSSEPAVALPDQTIQGDLARSVRALQAQCRRRGRQLRIDVVAETVVEPAAALSRIGLQELRRTRLMACTAPQYWPAPAVPGLVMQALTATAPLSDLKEHINTRDQSFEPGTALVSQAEVEDFRRELGTGVAFTAHLDGLAAGVGLLTAPRDGVSGLFGVATLLPFRRRGVATALTAFATQTAFARDVEVVFLDTDDPEAARLYERIGFQGIAERIVVTEGASG